MKTEQSFAALIQPAFETIMDGRERGIDPVDLALGFLGAARDVLIEEAGPEIAATALIAALDALREMHPEAVKTAAGAVTGQISKEGLQ